METRVYLDMQEGLDMEFKRSVAGLDSQDLVAFANSVAGGTILIGVDKSKQQGGHQRPFVVCRLRDSRFRHTQDYAEGPVLLSTSACGCGQGRGGWTHLLAYWSSLESV